MRCTKESYGMDIGNGFLKINEGRSPSWATPSWYAEVPAGSQFTDLDLYSQHVRYLDGDRPDLKGKEWLIGPAAKSQTRLFQRAVDAGKIEIGLQLVLGSIRPPEEMTESGTLFIQQLLTSLPDARRDADALKKRLGSRHIIELNGFKLAIGWGKVEVKEEGWGAYNYALRRGLLRPGIGNATIDIGCGTAIVSYWDENGALNYDARQPFEKGVDTLVQLIRADYRFKQRFGSDPKLHLILKGIEDRSLKYGTVGSFKDVFEEKCKQWIVDVLKSAISVLKPFNDELDKILIIGGGAALAEGIVTSNKILVCPNPQLANVLGLVPLNQPLHHLEGVA
jgi:SAM-dependent methyltransferase